MVQTIAGLVGRQEIIINLQYVCVCVYVCVRVRVNVRVFARAFVSACTYVYVRSTYVRSVVCSN